MLALILLLIVVALTSFVLFVQRPKVPNASFKEVNAPASLATMLLTTWLAKRKETATADAEEEFFSMLLNQKVTEPLSPFWVWLGRLPVLVLSKPETLKTVMSSTGEQSFVKGIDYEVHKSFLGEGLLTSTGPHWSSQRRLLSSAFNAKLMDRLKAQTHEVASSHFATLQRNKSQKGLVVDIVEESTVVFLKLATAVLFGWVGESPEEIDGLIANLRVLVSKMEGRMASGGFTASIPDSDFDAAKKEVVGTLQRILIQRKKRKEQSEDESAKPGDMLGTLLSPSAQLSDEKILDEMMTFLLVGHDASVSAIAFVLHQLLHPSNRASLSLLQSHLSDSESDRWLEAAIKETMRLFPPAAIFGRKVASSSGIEVEGVRVPMGTQLFIAPILTHRFNNPGSESASTSPLQFNINNFIGENAKGYSSEYLPFGIGPRNCIGMKFAMVEVRELLRYLLVEFPQMSLAPLGNGSSDLELGVAGLVIRPKNGLWVRLETL